uniref:hypothetical protein n=1 Tax=Lactobacillus acidophilus TaxID=1579 RepID=UPI003F54BADB
MHGKVIQFRANIDNFKVKNGLVTVNLTADTKDIVLDQLSNISAGGVMVNLEASQTELLPEEAENNANS